MPSKPQDPKKPLKAPLTSKYEGAEKVTYDPSKKGYKKQETIGTKTYYDKEANPVVVGKRERETPPSKDWEESIIKQLQGGVSPEELIKAGHISSSSYEKFKPYYKPVYTEPTTTVPTTTVTQPYAGTRSAMRLEPRTTASQPWDTYTVPDLNGQVNKSSTIMVDPKTGNVIDETKYLQTGDFSKSLTGKTLDEYRASNVRSDAQGQTNMLNTINGLPVTEQKETKIMKPQGDKQGTVLSSTSGGFKRGGLIGKIKGYADGGQTSDNSAQVAGMVGMGAGLAGQYGSQAIDKATQDEQGRYTRKTYENDPTNGNLAKFFNKGTLSGGVEGAGKGAAMGAALGPEGALIGAGVGLLAGSIKGTVQANRDAKSIQADADAITANEVAMKSARQNAINKANIDKQLLDRSQGLKDGGDVKETEMLQKKTVYPKPLPIKAPIVAKKTTMVVDKKGLEEQKKKIGYKDGGKIEGKGSGTSDSIKASVKANSFVVPSKNSDKAETIRRVVLGDESKKANLNQSNGEKVKLSNGEHLFTPNEVEKIETVLGDDVLDKLAPNSAKAEDAMEGETNEMEYAGGGPVPGQSNPNMTPTVKATTNSGKKSSKKAPVITPEYLQMRNSSLPVTQVEAEISPNGSLDVSEQIGVDKTTGKQVNPIDLNKLGNVAEYAIPMLQAGYGLSQLKKLGKRPVGELDKDYLASISKAQSNVDLANAQAKYGFTPEEQTLLNNQRAEAISAGRYAARNLSGGSAANAFNMERSLINQSTGMGLKAAVENRNLMLQKQGITQDKQAYLDAMIANKASMSRQLFGDKMNAWQQNQTAGSGLLASGLNNLINAKRYNDELAALKETGVIRNSAYNTLGQ